MKAAIIPYPTKMEMFEGTVNAGSLVNQQLNTQLMEEEYHLSIQPDGIVTEGGSEKALIYAKATLEQLYLQYGDNLPCLRIEDKPAYTWRAFHIDCARHFVQVEELKKMIRMAAAFKMNKFHWHFSDDQGWRIESAAFPRLHEIGSVRKGDHFGNYHSDEESGGYYTRDEVKDVVGYCSSLGIEVVPEVDMPGHVIAILAAYPELSCQGEPVEVETRGGIFRNVVCVGQESTFRFIERLLDDLLELFPGRFFHIGGDEAPKVRWKECKKCRKRMEEEGLSSLQQLQGYMGNRIIAYLKKHGRRAIVWNEAVNGENLDTDAYVQVWRTDDQEKEVAGFIAKGGKAIISNIMNSYCDYPYGRVSLKDMYELNLEPKEYKEVMDGIKVQGETSVVGCECLIWTEFVRDAERMEALCWPRYTASAEVGWCGIDRPGYDDFAKRLRTLFPVFAKMGIRATKEEGWIPTEEEAKRQEAEFNSNFSEEHVKEVMEAQAEV